MRLPPIVRATHGEWVAETAAPNMDTFMMNVTSCDAAPSSVSPVSMTLGLTKSADDLPNSWFEPRRSSLPPRRSSIPAPVETLGEFLGDALADAWLR